MVECCEVVPSAQGAEEGRQGQQDTSHLEKKCTYVRLKSTISIQS